MDSKKQLFTSKICCSWRAEYFLVLILLLGLQVGLWADDERTLVAYYSFDDALALNADDSGNGSDLLNSYAEAPSATTGRVGGAALFDGINDGYDIKLSLTSPPIYPDGAFSVSTWVKTGAGSAAGDCLSRPGSSIGGGFSIFLSGSPLKWYVALYDNGSPGYTSIDSYTYAAIDQWTHIAFSFAPTSGPDGDGVYTGIGTIYIDGVQKNSLGMTYRQDGYRFGLGNRAGGSSFYEGAIDEFAIFNGVLNGAEVGLLFSGANTPLDVLSATVNDPDALHPVVYYSFDEPNSVFGKDYSLNSYDADWINDSKPGAEINPCTESYAAHFNGAVPQAFLRENTTGLCPDGEFTAIAWLKPEAETLDGGTHYIVSGYNAGTRPNGWLIYIGGNKYCMSTYSPGHYDGISSGVTAQADEWAHVAIVYDPNSVDGDGVYLGTQRIYVNGVLRAEAADKHYQPHVAYADFMMIGARAGGSYPYYGSVDGVALWDSALDALQIKALADGIYSPLDLPARLTTVDGDTNGDGRVDLYDFSILSGDWQEKALK